MRDDDCRQSTHLAQDLRRILSGVYQMELADGTLHVRIRPLPGTLIVAGVRQADGLWLFMDREKPGAVAHARAMLRAHPELVTMDAAEELLLLTDEDAEPFDTARFVADSYEPVG